MTSQMRLIYYLGVLLTNRNGWMEGREAFAVALWALTVVRAAEEAVDLRAVCWTVAWESELMRREAPMVRRRVLHIGVVVLIV